MSQHDQAIDELLASFSLPENLELVDQATLERAQQFLALLASGLFGQGEIDPELMTWAERMSDARPSTVQLNLEDRLKAAERRFLTLVEQIPAVTFMAVLGEGEND